MKMLYVFNEDKAWKKKFFLDAPLFAYIHLLVKSKIITPKEHVDWYYTLNEEMRMIEFDVSKDDVIANVKTQLREDETMEDVLSIVDSEHFCYENVVDIVRINRVYANLNKAQDTIKGLFIKTLEEIIKGE